MKLTDFVKENIKPILIEWDKTEKLYSALTLNKEYYWITPEYNDQYRPHKVWRQRLFLTEYPTLQEAFAAVNNMHIEAIKKELEKLQEFIEG